MRKLSLLIIFLSFFCMAAQAGAVDVTAAYTGSSRFDQIEAGATFTPVLNVSVGAEARYVDEEAFKDPVYSLGLPVHLDFELLKINLTPFYYFKNKSDDGRFQDASAFGVNGKVVMTLQEDSVNDLYTHAFVGVSFARQKGTAFFDDGDYDNQYYNQLAYTLGFHRNYFRAFGFEVMGTAFHYPDGIDGVSGFRGVMNQQDLAFTQTYDIVHDLAKYALGARLTRMWTDTEATIYAGYRYGEFHTADPEHSFVLGNSFLLAQRLAVDFAYNHVRTIHNENKRDIFYVRLGMSF